MEADDAGEKQVDSAPRRVKCRYCGHTQIQGRFCDGCGMMFDAYRVEDAEELPGTRCPQCARHSTTRICPNCGIPIPGFPTEEET
jgi:DNA-directed RNA polymerase subunit RPC12/RpoP